MEWKKKNGTIIYRLAAISVVCLLAFAATGCGVQDVMGPGQDIMSLEDLAQSVNEDSEFGTQDAVGAMNTLSSGDEISEGPEDNSHKIPPEKRILSHIIYDDYDRIICEEEYDAEGRMKRAHYTSGYEAIYGDDTFIYTWTTPTDKVKALVQDSLFQEMQDGLTATVTKQDGSLYRIYQYDEEGVLRYDAWFVDDKLYQEAYYNASGKETKFVYANHDKLGLSHTYDENGYLTRIDYVDGQSDIYENDENGNVLINRWYNKKGKVRRTTTYTYDAEGRVLSWREHRVDDKDEEDQRRTYEYDEEGRLIYFQNIYFGGETYDYHLYFYDEYGNVIQDDFYQLFETRPDPVRMDTVLYTYDRYDHLLSKTEEWDGEVIYTESHEYTLDEDGCVLEDIQYRNGELYRRECFKYL